MNGFRFHSLSVAFLLLAVLMTFAHADAQPGKAKEKVLFSFPVSGDIGNSPNGVLISDGGGNLYGVNTYGGLGSGAVYEISPTSDGGWTAKSIYVFPLSTFFPGGLVMDSSGNLFGTVYSGGSGMCTDGYGNYSCGAVYELSPDGSGGWSEKIIWNGSQTRGWRPTSLTVDAAGNLYGTTIYSGTHYGGTVFQLQRSGDEWTATVLHAFGQPGSQDGDEPQGPLVFDKDGNLYGATFLGGTNGGGTVFELKKTQSGWEIINLFQFDSTGLGTGDGYGPNGVIFDKAGNLFGSTDPFYSGNANDVAFELSPASKGLWSETVLRTFVNGSPRGYGLSAVVFDSAGNLDGTAGSGGAGGYGIVFQLRRSSNGAWTEGILHSFPSDSTDGEYPGGLLPDSKGNLFGTTSGGGAEGVGTVFEITP